MSASPRVALVGRPSTFRDALEAFLAAVEDNPDAVADLWQAEWDRTLATKTVASRASYTSRYRAKIAAALGADHPALESIKVLDRTPSDPTRTFETREYGGRKPERRDRIDRFVAHIVTAREARKAADAAAVQAYETAIAAADQATPARRASAARKSADKKRAAALTSNADSFAETVRLLWADELRANEHLKPTSLRGATVQYRNALREAHLTDEALLAIVTVPVNVQKQVDAAYQSRIVARNHALVAVPHWRDLLDNAVAELPEPPAPGLWDTIDEEAEQFARRLDRPDLVRIGVALGLVTGRRPYEVFVTGSVAPLQLEGGRGVEMWRVAFHGQAKTKERQGSAFDETFAIPVLARAKTVVFAWRVLRLSTFGQTWSQMSNQEFRDDLLGAPNPNCIYPPIREELFAGLWPLPDDDDDEHSRDAKIVKSFNIRALYAEIADNFFRPQNMSKSAFFSSALGHTVKDLETAQAYMKYYLPDQKGSGPTRGVKTRLVRKITDRMAGLAAAGGERSD